jgi:hypothetical protein
LPDAEQLVGETKENIGHGAQPEVQIRGASHTTYEALGGIMYALSALPALMKVSFITRSHQP